MSAIVPFAPKGDRPRWQYFYDIFAGRRPGDVVRWAEFTMKIPDFDITKDRGAITKAGRELLLNEQHAVVSVRNEGYRIAHGSEHSNLE